MGHAFLYISIGTENRNVDGLAVTFPVDWSCEEQLMSCVRSDQIVEE